MNFRELFAKFGAADKSSTAIRAAMAKGEHELARLASEEQERQEALNRYIADGDAENCDRTQARLNELTALRTQLAKLREAQAVALAEAEQRELIEALHAEGQAVKAQIEQFAAFARKQYPGLVAQILAGIDLELRAIAARNAYLRKIAGVKADPETLASLPNVDVTWGVTGTLALHKQVNLPAIFSLDPTDAAPVPFYRTVAVNQLLPPVRGETSAAAEADRRKPTVIEGSRSLTPEENEANRRAGLVKGYVATPGGRTFEMGTMADRAGD